MNDLEVATERLISRLSRMIEVTVQRDELHGELFKAVTVTQAAAAVAAIAILTRYDIEKHKTPRDQFEHFCTQVEEYMTFMLLEEANE